MNLKLNLHPRQTLLLLLATMPAYVTGADPTEVHATADRVSYSQHLMLLEGHAEVRHAEARLTGQRLTIETPPDQGPEAEWTLHMQGTPAHIYSTETQDSPPYQGSARTIQCYHPAKHCTLTGEAQLIYGDHEITGASIVLNQIKHQVSVRCKTKDCISDTRPTLRFTPNQR